MFAKWFSDSEARHLQTHTKSFVVFLVPWCEIIHRYAADVTPHCEAVRLLAPRHQGTKKQRRYKEPRSLKTPKIELFLALSSQTIRFGRPGRPDSGGSPA